MTPGGLFLPDHPLPQPDFLASCPTRHLKLCQCPGILAENPHQFSPTFSLGKGSCQLGTLPGRVSLKEAAHTEMSLSGQDLFPSPAHPPLQPFWLTTPCLAADNELGLPKGQICPLRVFVVAKRVLLKSCANSVRKHAKDIT
uniref:Uncharacterized protein n=1 Tax=Rhinopithecus bieti TaxID=61621 RepID=A0A2K6MES0_RHIBE